MDYLIQQLSNDIHAFKTGGDAKYLSDCIKDTIYKISEGCRLTHDQARKLEFILHEISSDQALKWVIYDDLKKSLEILFIEPEKKSHHHSMRIGRKILDK